MAAASLIFNYKLCLLCFKTAVSSPGEGVQAVQP